MSTGEPSADRVHWVHRRPVWLIAALLAAAAIAVAAYLAVSLQGKRSSQSNMQSVLDGLVTGPNRIAPGVTAYVSGPHGTWVGSAGVANVKIGEPMRPSARMRLESNSKTWLTDVILQLALERQLNLNDSVERWLPGLLPYGDRITIQELMTDTSGLVDDNDFTSTSPAGLRAYLARVKDKKLRAQLVALGARIQANPAIVVPPIWLIRFAAWQPLLFTPGSRYHHSNIGWNILGLIVTRVAGKPLPVVYRERIFRPLGLKNSAYDPQGPIDGPHATGYALVGDRLVEATARHFGKGADGAIVSNARDEGVFLSSLMHGKVTGWLPMVWGGGSPSGCAGNVYTGSGAGDAFKTDVVYSPDRVAVILLNGRKADGSGDQKSADAALRLFCLA